MANILQVNNNIPINNQQPVPTDPERVGAQQNVQNPSNPQAVNRADGQNAGQTGSSTSEAAAGRVLDFEGSFAAFLRDIELTTDLPQSISDVLFGEGGMILFQNKEGLETVLDQLFNEISFEQPEELVQFMEDQRQAEVQFAGPFFNGVRSVLNQEQNVSRPLMNSIMDFVRTYTNYTSGKHYLSQIMTLGRDIDSLLLRSYQSDFEDLMNQVDWDAEPGNVESNSSFLNGQVIPFLSNYIAKTHDYGPVRNASIMLILYAIKYENGGSKHLNETLQKLLKNGDFRLLFKGDPESAWAESRNILQQNREAGVNDFSKNFGNFLFAGAAGDAGAENIPKFQQVMNGLLANESVYMPLMHMIVPFRYRGQNVMSEMWLDPDSKDGIPVSGDDGQSERQMKFLIKFNIQSLGNFEMVTLLKDRRVDMELYLPKDLMPKQKQIESDIIGILRRNSLSVANVGIYQRTHDLRLREVFPSLRNSQKGVNVRV